MHVVDLGLVSLWAACPPNSSGLYISTRIWWAYMETHPHFMTVDFNLTSIGLLLIVPSSTHDKAWSKQLPAG